MKYCLLRRLDRAAEAVRAYQRAIGLDANPAERAFPDRRRSALAGGHAP
ncbi:hypothetical protein ABTZ58_32360 [Streptomyces sp. NPDC094143]